MMSDTMPCGVPGCMGTMSFVSVELGYSCSNAGCVAHMGPDMEISLGGMSVMAEAKAVVAEVLAECPDRYEEGDFMLGGAL